ncbi:MAG TPA: type II toxin-antitoxin system HicA family toxin [Gammaproteobacteria bacterium]|nr:type II toxin-antitoxin system HicA family toxin [Gammaproteobacteria bacterium]
MNSRHRKTLEAVFTEPTTRTLDWPRIEALLRAVGCRTVEGSGSRVRFFYDRESLTLHRPHPAKEAKAYQVEDVRMFLERIGVRP